MRPNIFHGLATTVVASMDYTARAIAEVQQADVAFALGQWEAGAHWLAKSKRWAELDHNEQAARWLSDLALEANTWECTPKDWALSYTTVLGFLGGK